MVTEKESLQENDLQDFGLL